MQNLIAGLGIDLFFVFANMRKKCELEFSFRKNEPSVFVCLNLSYIAAIFLTVKNENLRNGVSGNQ